MAAQSHEWEFLSIELVLALIVVVPMPLWLGFAYHDAQQKLERKVSHSPAGGSTITKSQRADAINLSH